MIEETDIEKLFNGNYINPKFIERIFDIRSTSTSDGFDKDEYLFRVTLNSGDFEDSRSFKLFSECEIWRRDLIRWIIDLYKYVN